MCLWLQELLIFTQKSRYFENMHFKITFWWRINFSSELTLFGYKWCCWQQSSSITNHPTYHLSNNAFQSIINIQVIELINCEDKIYKLPVRHNKTEIIQNFDVIYRNNATTAIFSQSTIKISHRGPVRY